MDEFRYIPDEQLKIIPFSKIKTQELYDIIKCFNSTENLHFRMEKIKRFKAHLIDYIMNNKSKIKNLKK